jgi:hypothetical protein
MLTLTYFCTICSGMQTRVWDPRVWRLVVVSCRWNECAAVKTGWVSGCAHAAAAGRDNCWPGLYEVHVSMS